MHHRQGQERSKTMIRRADQRLPERRDNLQRYMTDARHPDLDLMGEMYEDEDSEPEGHARFRDAALADERESAGWGGDRDDDIPWGAFGRHRRGFDSGGHYDPHDGQMLGRGNWRSGARGEADRSGRAGFGWEDLEPEVEGPEDLDLEVAEREDQGVQGGPDSGLSESRTWEPPVRLGPHAGKGPRGYKRSDARILEEIAEHFTDHHNLDASEIEISVKDGEVTLEGMVNGRFEKRLAEDLAERVRGVTEIHNRLKIARMGA